MPRARKYKHSGIKIADDFCGEIVARMRRYRDAYPDRRMTKSYLYSMGAAARACRAGDYFDAVHYLMTAGREEEKPFSRGRKR